MDRIIHRSVRLHCDIHRAFEMFTVNEYVQSWLAPVADIEPVAGGRYELFWDPDNRESNSTVGCRVTAIEPDKFLAFEWKGPEQFQHFMNSADPLTHVVVLFVPGAQGSRPRTEVHIVHSGWRSSADWEEARQWFERAWSRVLDALARSADQQ